MPAFADADLGPEANWVVADPLAELPSVQNFVHTKDPDRIRIQYYRVQDATPLYAKVVFGPGAEGPPKHPTAAHSWLCSTRSPAGRAG